MNLVMRKPNCATCLLSTPTTVHHACADCGQPVCDDCVVVVFERLSDPEPAFYCTPCDEYNAALRREQQEHPDERW